MQKNKTMPIHIAVRDKSNTVNKGRQARSVVGLLLYVYNDRMYLERLVQTTAILLQPATSAVHCSKKDFFPSNYNSLPVAAEWL